MAKERKPSIPTGKDWRDAHNRPIVLSEALIEEVCIYLRNGNFLDTSAACAGIPKEVLQRWLIRGRRALALDPMPSADVPYAVFVREIEKASALAEKNNLARIERAGHTDWKAAAWLQSRRYKGKWGESTEIKHSGEVKHEVSHKSAHDVRELLSGLTLEQKKRMLEEIQRKKAAQLERLEDIRSREEVIIPDELE